LVFSNLGGAGRKTGGEGRKSPRKPIRSMQIQPKR